MKYSLNNRLILEVYKTDGSIKSEVKNISGFASIQAKTTLVGLKVLVGGQIDHNSVLEGDVAYVTEEALHTQPWAKKVFTCEELDEPFIIVNAHDVQFIGRKE